MMAATIAIIIGIVGTIIIITVIAAIKSGPRPGRQRGRRLGL
jgi:hypothetical protein